MINNPYSLKARFRGIQRDLRARLAAVIAPKPDTPGYEEMVLLGSYYSQVDTCQIPLLASLLEQFIGPKATGTFVEIGAYDGVTYSNSWGLAERGWAGLMVEPVPAYARACVAAHTQHPQVRVVNRAIGKPGQTSLTLHVAGPLTTSDSSTLAAYQAVPWTGSACADTVVVTVPCTTLDELLVEHGISRGFDLLVVDVEGAETAVFEGFSISNWAPRVMIVELADTHPDLHPGAGGDAEIAQAICRNGYRIVFKDHVNTVFVRTDSPAEVQM